MRVCNDKSQHIGKGPFKLVRLLIAQAGGKRTLRVYVHQEDLLAVDPQGSLTASLGYQQPDQLEETLADVLGFIITDKPVSPGMGIIHQAEGVDLLPANIELSGLEVTLVNTMSRETILREYLNSVREQYDLRPPGGPSCLPVPVRFPN